eukprot:TRINITY_DN18337_c0_g1_i1.p1 TRINITY_DN18337_c0_g1~~TRINITY_DN18337_c0_g1_i1.p1  ORF type:complete len:225 (-),score=11.88 TRINITY_DN18337_c0_g1_i1:216-890(-)
MASSFGERFAVLTSFAACFDACICGILPGGDHGRDMKAVLVTAAVAKALLAWLSLKMKFKLCSISFRGRAIAYSAWFALSAIISLALLVYADGRFASDRRYELFVCLRLVDFFMIVGVIAYASRQQDRLCARFQSRVWRLCTFDDLKSVHSSRNLELSKLSCSICLEDLRPHDTIAVHHCNHVAHMFCEQQLILQRRLRRLECPMMCSCDRKSKRCSARRMHGV